MTQSKAMGTVLIAGGLCWCWWRFLPLVTSKYPIPNEAHVFRLFGGWIVALLISVVYGWWMYEPTIALKSPPVSFTEQSGAVAGNTARLANVQEITHTLAAYSRSGHAMRRSYESPLDISAVAATKWSQEVVRYLTSSLHDPSYVTRFESDRGPNLDLDESILAHKGVSRQNLKVHRYLSTRLYQLQAIMKDLRRRGEK